MLISLSCKEASVLVDIANSVESNGSNELKEIFKDNKVIKYEIAFDGTVSINVNPEYMVEFLTVYQKYIGLFVDQAKALYRTVCMFQEEAECIIEKYTIEDKEEVKDNNSDPCENTGNFY